MPGYGTAAFDDEATCAEEANVLKCAQNKLRTQFELYTRNREHIEAYRNAANLSLFGIGGAAGVNTVTKGSKEGLQTLGLAAAGIVGLDGVLKADDQYATYGGGVEALQCLMDVDQGFRTLQAGLNLPDGQTSRALQQQGVPIEIIALWPYLEIQRNSMMPDAAPAFRQMTSATARDQRFTRLDVEDAATNGFRTLYNTASSQMAVAVKRASSGSLPFLLDTYNRQVQLIQAAEDDRKAAFDIRIAAVATDDRTRAGQLISALNDIRRHVSDRLLFTNADLAKIYDALKKALEKAKVPPAAPGGSTTTAPGGTKPTINTLINNQPATRQLSAFAAQLALARQDNLVAQNAARPYETCVKLAEKKGNNPGGPQTAPANTNSGGSGG